MWRPFDKLHAKVVTWPSNSPYLVMALKCFLIFLLNDMDGDGCITREEWLGSDAVFDALDTDHDGRLAPEDVRGGLGAPLALSAAAG
jgi:hypothetical protein